MTEVASFLTDDPDALVAASLACPMCLGAAARVELEGDADEARARCSCSTCGTQRIVELLPGQYLRLSLMLATV